MPRLRFFIEGDASGYTKAMEEAQRRQDRAAQRAEEIAKTLEGLDRRRAEMTKQMLASVDKEEKAALERRVAMLDRAQQDIVRSERKALGDLARAEKELTKVVDGEAKERARARAKEASERAQALQGGVAGIARGIGLPVPAIGLGPAAIAAAATFGAGLTLRKGIEDAIEWSRAVRDMQIAAQGGAREVSTLMAVVDRLGVPVDALDRAFQGLAQSASNNPEQFAALGISLRNADGSARPLIAILLELREKLAGSRQDAAAMQLAQELLGRSSGDLRRFLFATNEEIAHTVELVSSSSKVLGDEGVTENLAFAESVKRIEGSYAALANMIGGAVIPVLAGFFSWVGEQFDKVGTFIHELGNRQAALNRDPHFAIEPNWEIPPATPESSGGRGIGDAWAKATEDAARRAREASERARKAAQIGIQRSSGTDVSDALRAAQAAADRERTEALREQIEALRELQQAERERVREAIDAIRQEVEAEDERHRKMVEAIDEARRLDLERIREIREREAEADRQDDERRREALRALEDRRDRELDAVRRTQEAERDAAEAAIAAVRARMRAADEAARKQDEAEARRRILGQDTVSQLQARIAELERLARIEDDEERRAEARKELAAAEAELAKETAVEVVRFRSDTEEEYLDKVREQQEKVAAAERRVAEVRKAIARDAKREQLRVQIEAIQEEIRAEEQRTELARVDRENERRATQEAAEAEIASIQQRLEASDRGHKKRLEQINAEVEAERRRIEEGQRAEDERRRKRDQAHEQEIRAINQAAESARRAEDERSRSFKQAADERIRKHEDELKAFEKNIDAQVKALEKLVRAITSIPDKRVNVNVHTSYTSSGTPPAGGGPTIDPGVVTPDWTTKPSIDSMPVDAQMDYIRRLRENYYRGGGGGGDMIQQAAGGSVLLREPHFLVSARTGRANVVAAEHGSEVVNFGGIGREDAGGGFSTTVIVQGGVDSRDRAFEIAEEQYRWYRLRGGRR